MKIIKLQAENIKKLKAVEITPDGNTVVISGKNGQGKTSVLDSIWFALGGGDAAKNTPRPIRDGEKQATVTLDLGDYKVTRNWTSNENSYLKVETKDGAKYPSPQKLLDSLVGQLSFDPLAFSTMDDKSQLKTLLGLVELSIDPAEVDRQKKEIFDQRTLVNRDVKNLEGQLAAIPEPAEDVPAEEVSSSAVLAELQVAQGQLNTNNEKRRELQELARESNGLKADIQATLDKIAEMQAKLTWQQGNLDAINIKGKALKAEVEKLVDPDLSIFQTKLQQVEQINNSVRLARQYKGVSTSLSEKTAESKKLTEQITGLEKQKDDALKAAKFPVDGLGFDESGVTFGKIPFKQCSAGERLKVSLAMAMALNPKLRVIRITDGSLLDSDNMKLIESMAKDNDYQVWIEIVNESGTLGVYIEDGEVK